MFQSDLFRSVVASGGLFLMVFGLFCLKSHLKGII